MTPVLPSWSSLTLTRKVTRHTEGSQLQEPPFSCSHFLSDHLMAMQLGRDIEGALVAVIADEDTITGFLLAGVGDIDIRKKSNFLVVDSKTTVRDIEAAFKDYTSREDIAIVLISQPIANMIRHVVSTYNKVGAAARQRCQSGHSSRGHLCSVRVRCCC